MEIEVEKLTDWNLVLNLARGTMGIDEITKEPSEKFKRGILDAEHSPVRALMFKVVLKDIPYFASVHLVRHKHGVEHFVSTQRTDRTGEDRNGKRQDAPVLHKMIINAQALMFMSRRRLCGKADITIRKIWSQLVCKIAEIDPILAEFCVPMCKHRGNVCHESTSCGISPKST